MAARGRFEQRGLALLSVLLILVLLSTLAAYMADDENLAIRRIENQREAEQGFQVALGAEQWAIKVLERDLALSKPGEEVDHLQEDWAKLGPPVKVEEGTMQAAIMDEQAKFNLNNLIEGRPVATTPVAGGGAAPVKKVWYLAYRQLLQSLSLPEQLADVLVDWMDSDSDESGSTGAEDYYYEGLDTPYRAANQTLKNIGELRLLKGYTDEVITRLLPLVTALPVNGTTYIRFNANTVPAMLFTVLGSKKPLPSDAVGVLVEARTAQPFANIQKFADAFHGAISDPDAPLAQLVDVKSDYFTVDGCAAFGRVQFGIRSLLYRDSVKQNVKVLRRQRFFTCPQITVKQETSEQK